MEWARLLGRQRGGWGGGLSSRDRAALVSNGDGARSTRGGRERLGGDVDVGEEVEFEYGCIFSCLVCFTSSNFYVV